VAAPCLMIPPIVAEVKPLGVGFRLNVITSSRRTRINGYPGFEEYDLRSVIANARPVWLDILDDPEARRFRRAFAFGVACCEAPQPLFLFRQVRARLVPTKNRNIIKLIPT
jgi:hypothetical protein